MRRGPSLAWLGGALALAGCAQGINLADPCATVGTRTPAPPSAPRA
jgi:hypothetical protein